jgi:hypothetical protein
MKYAVRSLLLSVLVVVAALSCDKATPTAPSGSTLAISASPSRISLNGSATITVIGRLPNGSPMREGTEIHLTTSLGNIDPLVLIDRGGNATATLRADGRRGTATVSAATGTVSGGGGGSGGAGGSGGSGGTGGTGGTTGTSGTIATQEASQEASLSVSTTVQIGESDDTKPTLIVSANPTIIPVAGTSTITIIGRNIDGSPVASGQEILLTTTLGTLQPRRPTTNSSGIATSTLTASSQAGAAKVTAVLGTSDAATVDIEIKDATLTLTADTTTVDEGTSATINLTARVRNFQGQPVPGRDVTFQSQRGTLQSTSGVTDSTGTVTTVLRLTPQTVSGTADETFTVTATASSTSGVDLSSTVTITIRNVS